MDRSRVSDEGIRANGGAGAGGAWDCGAGEADRDLLSFACGEGDRVDRRTFILFSIHDALLLELIFRRPITTLVADELYGFFQQSPGFANNYFD